MKRRDFLIAGLSLAAAGCASRAQDTSTKRTAVGVVEDFAFTADFDGSEQRYAIIRPTGTPRDAIIALHGHGSDRNQFVTAERDECRAVRDFAMKNNMLLVSPDYRAPTSWMGPAAEADMLQLIEILRREEGIKRIFLCGGSMGGTSALTFAALHPRRLYGVASMNGTANHVEYTNFQDAIAASFGGTKDTAPDEYRKRSAEFFPEQFTMPVGLTAGGKDTVVPAASIVRLEKALRQRGAKVLLVYREEGDHATSYEDACAILEFMYANARLRGKVGSPKGIGHLQKTRHLPR